jgi:HEPN domain-containing protein
MNKLAKNFLLSSEYDIETARHLLKTKRYIYVIFMCHLSVEKMLKAILSKIQNEHPPKVHNLLHLADLCKLEIPEKHQTIIKYLNTVSIPTRYPEDVSKMAKQFNQQVATRYFSMTKEFLKWLVTFLK